MKKHKRKIILGLIIAAALAIAFICGGAPKKDRENQENSKVSIEATDNILVTESEKSKDKSETKQNSDLPLNEDGNVENTKGSSAEKEKIQENAPKNTGDISLDNSKKDVQNDKDDEPEQSEPTPSHKAEIALNTNSAVTDKELTCTLSVRCDTVLQNISHLDNSKLDIIPKDGVIYEERTVTFYEGESVFNLLLREMKKNKIHLEFENTPIYESAYIEGIGNLYEFDCGELSGWMYKVNGSFPNYGCSQYKLQDGDKVEWVYTCDLGKDVGGDYSQRNGK